MDLGTFSVSLAVKDIAASRAFYEKLGFTAVEGGYKSKEFPTTEETDWLIMQNGDANIGLFMGMFEDNVLTFNPTDARAIQKSLKESGVELTQEADEEESGPTHLFLFDPDGNPILIDQH